MSTNLLCTLCMIHSRDKNILLEYRPRIRRNIFGNGEDHFPSCSLHEKKLSVEVIDCEKFITDCNLQPFTEKMKVSIQSVAGFFSLVLKLNFELTYTS